MTIAKKGREYLVAITQLERTYKTRFKKGDIVIALEDDICPYCCFEINYKPGISPLSEEYSSSEIYAMSEEELEGPKEDYEEIIQNVWEVDDIVD